MRRLALGLSLTGCLLVPVTAEALGLGSIDVHTDINQPLRADIGLRDVASGDLTGIMVSLASPGLFQRVGIPRPDYLSQLHFAVVKGSNGRASIEVTTPQPVSQPFLDFLVEVNWSGGRLLREYTVLLNPPHYMQGQAASSVQTPTSVSSLTHPLTTGGPTPAATRPLQSTTRASQTPVRKTPAGRGTRSYSQRPAKTRHVVAHGTGHYAVVKGDTLWGIVKKSGAVSEGQIDRMMVSVLRANPKAFIRGNINGLRSGYVLRIPAKSELANISAKQAAQEVRNQDGLWRQYAMHLSGKTVPEGMLKNTGKVQSTHTGKAASSAVATHSGQTSVAGGKLKIMGTESKAPGTASAHVVVGGSQASIKHQLALANEAVVSNGKQIDDLKSRINALQGIVTKQKQLLKLKNQELATLQGHLSHPSTQVKPAGVAVPAATSAVKASAQANKAGEKANGHVTAVPAHKLAEKHPVRHVVRPVRPAPPQQQEGLISTILGNPDYLMAIGLMALLVLALLWLIARRSSKSKAASSPKVRGLDSEVDMSVHNDSHAGSAGVAVAAGAVGAAAVAGAVVEAHDDGFDAAGSDDQLGDLPGFAEANDDQASGEVEHHDVLAEADVYIAYGLYSQAESILKEAIEAQPDNAEYHVKLLECYFNADNKGDFDQEAQSFYESLSPAQRDDGIWQRVASMGKSLSPDNALFSGVDGGKTAAESVFNTQDDLGEFDIGNTAGLAGETFDLGSVEESAHADEGVSLSDELEPLDLNDFTLNEEDNSLSLDDFEMPSSISAAEDKSVDDKDDSALDISLDEFDKPLDLPASTGKIDFNATSDNLNFEALDDELPHHESGKATSVADLTDNDLDSLDFDFDLSGDHDIHLGEDDLAAGSTENELVTDGDAVATKLDLAKAYIDMGDDEGALSTLKEVLAEGNAAQIKEAETLLKQIS